MKALTSNIPSYAGLRLPCTCANLRRADRLVTQIYNEELAPAGMPVTQFTLLQALNLAPAVTQKQLGELLGIDSTTLSRTLAGPQKRGLIRGVPGKDRREISLSLTAAGQREYRRALPFWDSAQKRLRHMLGESEWQKAIDAFVAIANTIDASNRDAPHPRMQR